jgi:Ca2+-binding RTX toxin-like protein
MTISSTAGTNSSINGKVTLNKLNANYLANPQDVKITGNDINNIIDASQSLLKLNLGGGKGDDLLIASNFGNDLYGNDGNDSMTGGNAADFIWGGNGDDSISGGTGNDTIDTGSGNNMVSGGEGDDMIVGNKGNDFLNGDAGNDLIKGDTGNDSLNGGVGNDTLSGGDSVDSLNGGDGNDMLYGDNGNDIVIGGSGNDYIQGGVGADTLTGGTGADTFYISYKDNSKKSPDIITDFNKVDGDKLLIALPHGFTLLGNYVAATKGHAAVMGRNAIPATATHDYIPATSDIPAIPATPAINMPAANQGAFDPITQTLYINLNDTPAFEMAIKLTGITDFSQITLA